MALKAVGSRILCELAWFGPALPDTHDCLLALALIDAKSLPRTRDPASDKVNFRASIDLGKILHLTVIAEGVKTGAQRSLLALSGCDEGRGSLFCRPVSAEQFERLLEQALGDVTEVQIQPSRIDSSVTGITTVPRDLNDWRGVE